MVPEMFAMVSAVSDPVAPFFRSPADPSVHAAASTVAATPSETIASDLCAIIVRSLLPCAGDRRESTKVFTDEIAF